MTCLHPPNEIGHGLPFVNEAPLEYTYELARFVDEDRDEYIIPCEWDKRSRLDREKTYWTKQCNDPTDPERGTGRSRSRGLLF